MKILLGQLGANGDCLYATTLARQIRHDYPDAHITWAVTDRYKGATHNNPHIDEVWLFPLTDSRLFVPLTRNFEHEALKRRNSGEFDLVVYSQIWPSNFQNYDGTVRPSILRAYGRPITVPAETVLNLTEEEIGHVTRYVVEQNLLDYDHRIIFECSSTSGQSFVTPDYAQAVAALVYEELPNATVILSSNLDLSPAHPNTKSAGSLSLREISGLTRAGTLFVGCGSGCTVAATSAGATPLPMIQILSAGTSVYASFAHDFAHYGRDNSHILEMTDENPAFAANAIIAACRDGIGPARERFHSVIEPTFGHYGGMIQANLLAWNRAIDAARSVMATAARYGWKRDLIAFAIHYVVPKLHEDSQWHRPDGRRGADAFMESLNEAARTMD